MLTRRDMIWLSAATSIAVPVSAAGAQMGADASSPPDADTLVERLLKATGGRESWARVKGIGISGVHLLADFPEPLDNQLYVAFDEPLMRFEARGSDFRQTRVIARGRGSYSTRGGPVRPMTEAAIRSDLDWWETHFYRNIHRLAVRDPALSPRVHRDGRLELYRKDEKRLVWYRLNQRGEPIAYGSFDQEEGNVFGPLQDVEGGLKLPTFAASHDGTFRAMNLRPTLYAAVPPVDFEKP